MEQSHGQEWQQQPFKQVWCDAGAAGPTTTLHYCPAMPGARPYRVVLVVLSCLTGCQA